MYGRRRPGRAHPPQSSPCAALSPTGRPKLAHQTRSAKQGRARLPHGSVAQEERAGKNRHNLRSPLCVGRAEEGGFMRRRVCPRFFVSHHARKWRASAGQARTRGPRHVDCVVCAETTGLAADRQRGRSGRVPTWAYLRIDGLGFMLQGGIDDWGNPPLTPSRRCRVEKGQR